MGRKKAGALPKGVSLRKDGRYEWRLKYEYSQYRGYAKTAQAAEKARADKLYEVSHGIYSKTGACTVDQWFNDWIEVYKTNLKDSTRNNYKETYKRYISPRFGSRQIKKLKSEQIQRFTNEVAANYSRTIASSVNFLLFDMLRQAARNRIIPHNPMENTTPPKLKKPTKRNALSAQEETLFLTAASDSPYYMEYVLATQTGMRIGEVLGLMWSDVDFENREIHVNRTLCYIPHRGRYLDTPKSKNSIRTIPMTNTAAEILRKRKMQQLEDSLKHGKCWRPMEGMEDLVFTARRYGTPIDQINVQKDMRNIVARLKEEGTELHCTFHTLRHCFATRCIEAGMTPKTLQMILGHSTLAMTMDLYCDVMEETKRKEMERVSDELQRIVG